jgi:uncharacterized membrane protein
MRVILVIALVCLILSILVNVLTFTDYNESLNRWKEFINFLFLGVLLVWVPLFLRFLKQSSCNNDPICAKCPNWMRLSIKLCNAYCIINYILVIFTNHILPIFTKTQSESDYSLRFFSGIWIAAFAWGAGEIYSHILSDKSGNLVKSDVEGNLENKIR